MREIGVFLSSEGHGPRFLLTTARQVSEAGFRAWLISYHYHTWTTAQGATGQR